MSTPLETVVQWYPGHMAQAMRKLGERLSIVDVVVEVLDARVPSSSANPYLDELTRGKTRIVVFGRDDLADGPRTRDWLAWYAAAGRTAIPINGKDPTTVKRVAEAIKNAAVPGALTRVCVVGIPNTGKSTVINGLLRRTAAKVEDKAGVTRALQWFRLGPKLEVMDTPGILVPKIATPDAQWQLALTGALPRERFDSEEIVERFTAWAHARKLDVPTLDAFAQQRGFVRRGGEPDIHNAAGAYIKDVNDAKMGRITFEDAPA